MTGADHDRLVYAFDHPHERSLDELVTLLGGKGANLASMTSTLGLPVPPGFTITAPTCVRYLAEGWPDGLDAEIDAQLAQLEAAVGRRFGDATDPLLVSVRSGAAVSMPGMMDTILNLGLNAETTAGLAAVSGKPDFAAACCERFEHMFTDIVGSPQVPADPREQLRMAIRAVFDSWNSERARTYRRIEEIDDSIGTAVTVQAMVFGNRSAESCTGVLFTRDPATGEATPFGDVLFEAQGEDVVDGSHATSPVASLDQSAPGIASELWAVSNRLERHHRDLCDIEFTVEDGKLWLLQVRAGKRSPQAAVRIAREMADEPDFPLDRHEALERVKSHLADPPTQATAGAVTSDRVAIATGLGASPGMATGQIVLSADAAVEASADGTAVILVRSETSPADVHGMAEAAGILTTTGGLASHAAVVARGWGVPAVVGAADVVITESGVVVGAHDLVAGSTITIDGATGEVFAGEVQPDAVEIVPDAAVLLTWAADLGIDIADADPAETSGPAAAASPESAAQPMAQDPLEALIQLLAIKKWATPAAAGEIMFVDEAAVAEVVEANGDLVEPAGAMVKLSDAGQARADAALAGDQASLGIDAATAALDAFLPLDHRMKVVVTAWQMRTVDGEEVLNDHTDADYDATVLGDLAALHGEAGPWIDSLTSGLPRLDAYRRRLDRALALAQGGDAKYMASPLADSYHNVWFELHEDLIRLAGRTRAEEVAAGRA